MTDPADVLDEGWYLMSTEDVEAELRRFRGQAHKESNAERLSIADALAYKRAGNVPDGLGRSLRLVLHVRSQEELSALDRKRLMFEPDYLEEPTWRKPGSKPINVVPLRASDVVGPAADDWWQQPDLQSLEEDWKRTGTVDGVVVPAEYRGFVYKTVLSLRAAGKEVSVTTIVDSVARWLGPRDLELLRDALERSNG